MYFNKSQSNPHYIESAVFSNRHQQHVTLIPTASKPFPIQTSQTDRTCPCRLGVQKKLGIFCYTVNFIRSSRRCMHHCASLAISQILFYLWPGSLLQCMNYHIFLAVDNSESLLLIHLSHQLQQIISFLFLHYYLFHYVLLIICIF